MEILCIKTSTLNYTTGEPILEPLMVYKDNIYNVVGEVVINGCKHFILAEKPYHCAYMQRNFMPLDTALDEISIENLIEEEICA